MVKDVRQTEYHRGNELLEEQCVVGLYRGMRCLIVRYGCRSDTSDIDILVTGEDIPVYEQVRVGVLDLTLVPSQDLIFLATMRDLVVSAPLLDGDVLVDPSKLHSEAVGALSRPVPIEEVVEHHLSRSFACRDMALSYMRGRSAQLALAADSLAWSCSYYLAARRFSGSAAADPLRLPDLVQLQGGEMISRARELARDIRAGQTQSPSEHLKKAVREADGMFFSSGPTSSS